MNIKEINHFMLECQRVYYNFVKPHMALDGKTPAEASGLCLDIGEDRWLGLLKKSLQHRISN